RHRARRRDSGRGIDRPLAESGRRVETHSGRPRRVRDRVGGPVMPQRDVVVANEAGIHARPAAEIVKLAAKFRSEIVIVRDGLEVNAKSIMGVMMLAAECGSTITIRADGDDADAALDALSDLIANKFGEHSWSESSLACPRRRASS